MTSPPPGPPSRPRTALAVRWTAPVLLLALAGVLLLRYSNLAWHQSQGFLTIAGRYSTEYFAAVLTLVFVAAALAVSLLSRPASATLRVLRGTVLALLVCAYSLSAVLVVTEYYFHHHPMLALGRERVITPGQILIAMAEGRPDPEVGKLPFPNESVAGYRGSFDLRYRYPPGEWRDTPAPVFDYRSDAHGFRNDRIVEDPDLLVLGDSFTQGAHVQRDELWSSRTAAALGWTDHNLGLSGFCPPQHTVLLRRYGLPLRPRHVIMQVFPNDLAESATFDAWRKSGKTYLAFFRDSNPIPSMFLTWEFFRQLFPRAAAAAGVERAPIEARLVGERVPLGFGWVLGLLTKTEEDFAAHQGTGPFLAGVEEAHRLCRERGIPFLVLLAPMKVSIYWDAFADDDQRRRFVEEQWPDAPPGAVDTVLQQIPARRDNLFAFWRRRFDDQGIPWLDLTEPFRAHVARTGELLYFPVDTHWNPAGHRLAAECVTAYYRQQTP